MGLFAGLISAFIVIALVEMLGHSIYPPPEGLDFSDTEQLKTHIDKLPFGALFFVLLAYWIGSFAGGLTLGIIASKKAVIFALILGGLLTIAGLFNLLDLPGHPIWFWILSLASYIPFTLFGLKYSSILIKQSQA